MRKLIIFSFCFIFLLGLGFVPRNLYAEVLTGSVTAVPDSFFGTWRVVSKLVDTDSVIFKENNLDLWNLSRLGDVITLCNPFNGAEANITVNSVNGSYIVFRKTGKYSGKDLTDVVEIKLNGDSFSGTDTLKLDTYSDVTGKIIKTETAKYSIKGEKISGEVGSLK